MKGLKDILTWFEGRLSARKTRKMFEKLRQDPEGRREYERQASIERWLSGHAPDKVDWTDMDTDRNWNAIRETMQFREKKSQKTKKRWLALAPVATLILLILMLPVGNWFQDSYSPEVLDSDGLTPKGSSEENLFHLFLFCIEKNEGKTVTTRLDNANDDEQLLPSCSMNGELQFAITNQEEEIDYLYVAGLDEQGRRLWYFPKPGEGRSLRIEHDVKNLAFGESMTVGVNHHPGIVHFFAVFSETPIDDEEMDEALRTWNDSEPLLPLERKNAFQQRFEGEIINGEKDAR